MKKFRVPATRTKAAAKLFIVVLFGLALSLSGSARFPPVQAYRTYRDARWFDYDLPVVVNLEGITQSLGSIRPDKVRTEIIEALSTWNSVGTRLRFVEGQGANCREQVVVEIATPAQRPPLAGKVAMNGFMDDECRCGAPPTDPLRGACIIINRQNRFKTNCETSLTEAADLQTVVLHELGHTLGLTHTQSLHLKAVMWEYTHLAAQLGCRRKLTQDDIDGLISLYGPSTRVQPATTPRPMWPPHGIAISREQAEVDWDDSSNAVSYYIQVSESADFLVPVFMANPVQSSVASIPGLGYGITYYWRVKAKGDGGNSTWSEIREFAIGTPAFAPALYEQSEFPILQPGEETEIYFALHNIGSQTWEAGHYALVNVNGIRLGARPQMALNVDVPPGSSVVWRFTITAPVMPGVYRTEWRFSYDGHLFGSPLLWTDVIVVPGGSDDLAEIIRRLIEEAREDAEDWIEEQWEELRRQIIEMIEAEIRRRIEEFLGELCGGSVATAILCLSVLWSGHRRSRVGNREH